MGRRPDARPRQPPASALPLEGQVSAELVINPCGQGSGHGYMAIHMSIELGSQGLAQADSSAAHHSLSPQDATL